MHNLPPFNAMLQSIFASPTSGMSNHHLHTHGQDEAAIVEQDMEMP